MKLPFDRILVSLVSLVTIFGAFIFDWDETHIFNPNWPPHAKFHNGQTMSMGVCLGILSLWLLWRKKKISNFDFGLAVAIASLYWITQASAILYPGTDFFDPNTVNLPRSHALGLPIQVVLQIALYSFLGSAVAIRLISGKRTYAASESVQKSEK
ncbi:MAG: hypothetical protein K2Y39_25940 [Candidatus Obscuribacterales bacterium]|nr:hypothetical protein [Candidatus Obscuribacterales bacterium]